jgi:general secretion pathway protein L
MTKQLIGIEITTHCIRMAILTTDKEHPWRFTTLEQARDEDDIGQLMLQMLGSRLGFADRCCTTLSITNSFVRRLSFPFSDPHKIAAAAPMELGAQLPVDISNHIVATSLPIAGDKGVVTTAAAASAEDIAAALQPFDAGISLHVLGLSPYTEACGLKTLFSDGFLVLSHEKQLVISLLQHGQIISFEDCGAVNDDGATLADIITAKTILMCHSSRLEPQPLCLIGSDVSPKLQQTLVQQGMSLVELPLHGENDQALDPKFLPVCARALAADQPTINFRRGSFTLKSEWAALKKHLYVGAALLVVALIIAGGTALHTYRHKTNIAEKYRQQINQIFRQTLPESKVIIDIPRQLQSALQQLKTTGKLVGLDKSTSALAILRSISSNTPEDIKVDVKTFTYEPQLAQIDGVTNSFDSVNRWASALRSTAIFSEVRIADAKMGIDGQQVNFRLQLAIGPQGEQL